MIKKILGKVLMVLLPVFILLLAVFLVAGIKRGLPEMRVDFSGKTPTPTPQEVLPPSRWATDSAVLEIEKNIQALSQDLQSVDLKEFPLSPPVLDMKISF